MSVYLIFIAFADGVYKMITQRLLTITEKILKGEGYLISPDEAMEIAGLPEEATLDLIFCANRIREKRVFMATILHLKQTAVQAAARNLRFSSHLVGFWGPESILHKGK